MKEPKRPRPSQADAPSQILSIEAIDTEYKGQWVAVRVTARNEYHTPLEGQVVAHGTHKHVYKVLTDMVTSGRGLDATHYVFPAGALIHPHTEAMRQYLGHSPAGEGPGAAGQR